MDVTVNLPWGYFLHQPISQNQGKAADVAVPLNEWGSGWWWCATMAGRRAKQVLFLSPQCTRLHAVLREWDLMQMYQFLLTSYCKRALGHTAKESVTLLIHQKTPIKPLQPQRMQFCAIPAPAAPYEPWSRCSDPICLSSVTFKEWIKTSKTKPGWLLSMGTKFKCKWLEKCHCNAFANSPQGWFVTQCWSKSNLYSEELFLRDCHKIF